MIKETLQTVADGDDPSAPYLNAKHQIELFWSLFTSKRYMDAAFIAKALEISAKQMVRGAHKAHDTEAANDRP